MPLYGGKETTVTKVPLGWEMTGHPAPGKGPGHTDCSSLVACGHVPAQIPEVTA